MDMECAPEMLVVGRVNDDVLQGFKTETSLVPHRIKGTRRIGKSEGI